MCVCVYFLYRKISDAFSGSTAFTLSIKLWDTTSSRSYQDCISVGSSRCRGFVMFETNEWLLNEEEDVCVQYFKVCNKSKVENEAPSTITWRRWWIGLFFVTPNGARPDHFYHTMARPNRGAPSEWGNRAGSPYLEYEFSKKSMFSSEWINFTPKRSHARRHITRKTHSGR